MPFKKKNVILHSVSKGNREALCLRLVSGNLRTFLWNARLGVMVYACSVDYIPFQIPRYSQDLHYKKWYIRCHASFNNPTRRGPDGKLKLNHT